MTGSDATEILKNAGVSAKQGALLLGCIANTIYRWAGRNKDMEVDYHHTRILNIIRGHSAVGALVEERGWVNALHHLQGLSGGRT